MSSAILTGLLVLLVNAGVLQSTLAPRTQDSDAEAALLTSDQKSILAEAFCIQLDLGEDLWPGFGQASIPIIVYDDRMEFLVRAAAPPSPWSPVEDDFEGKPYYRRTSSHPQSFAVSLGSRSAASIGTLAYMNQAGPREMTRQYYIPFVLHEMFHAFQADESAGRFRRAQDVYAVEPRYPAKEVTFLTAWDHEGAVLAGALGTKDRSALARKVTEFLAVRDTRRAEARLTAELVAYERELEWLEGLGKYIEDRVSDLAAARREDPRYASYRLPYWRQADTFRLSNQLGRQDGDLRFYLSGMAQARLLDILSPGWKKKAMQPGVYLENLLRAAVE